MRQCQFTMKKETENRTRGKAEKRAYNQNE